VFVSSVIIEREFDDIRKRVDETRGKIRRWLLVLALVFVLYFLIPTFLLNVANTPLSYSWSFSLFPLSISFFVLAIYFTSLLRKPQFAALNINKKGSNLTAADDASKPKRASEWTPARVFNIIYFTWVTVLYVGVSALMLLSASWRTLAPATQFLLVASIVVWAAVLYVPLFLVSFVLRRRKSTELKYIVPVFYGFNIGFTWFLFTALVLFVPLADLLFGSPISLQFGLYQSSLFSFLLLILVSFMLGDRVLSTARFRAEEISAPILQERLITDGVAILPRSVPVGSSCNVMIDFDLSKYVCENAATNADACCRQLEVELQAAGITVDGEKRLRLCPDSPLPIGIWNCYFPNTGHNTVNVILREVKSPRNASGSTSDTAREVIFVHKTDVKVYGLFAGSSLAFLTLVISGFAAIATFIGDWGPITSALHTAANSTNTTAKPIVDILQPSILSAMQILANGVHALVH